MTFLFYIFSCKKYSTDKGSGNNTDTIGQVYEADKIYLRSKLILKKALCISYL